MSSLRNALPRREHWERAQPLSRSKLGLLEKKRDYKLRSTDHHRKQSRLLALREKASFRNPDEFYFAMQHTTSKHPHRTSPHTPSTPSTSRANADAALVAKTRDVAYLALQASRDTARAERLRAEVHGTVGKRGGDGGGGGGARRTHTVFVEDEEELERFDAAGYFGTTKEMVGRAFNRVRVEDMGREDLLGGLGSAVSRLDKGEAKKLKKEVERKRKEMELREERAARLRGLMVQVDTEKALLGKGHHVKVADADPRAGTPAVYRWRKQRQR